MNTCFTLLVALIGLLPGYSLFAVETNAADRSSGTVFLRFGGGMHSYKSELLDSNDTGTTVDYSLGIYAGEERDIGILFNRETSTTSFVLNDSSLSETWQDIHLRYRISSFHLGAVIASMSMLAKNDANKIDLDLVGSGYGANFGWVFGFLRYNAWYLDVTSVSISEVREAHQTVVSMGSRLDIDTGVSFFVTRDVFDVLFGYRKRTYSITTDSAFSEAQDTTYLAFRFNAFM